MSTPKGTFKTFLEEHEQWETYRNGFAEGFGFDGYATVANCHHRGTKENDMKQEDLVQWLRPEKGALEAGPSIKIIKVRPGQPVKGFFLSDSVIAVATHWIAGRTKPCLGIKNDCDSCRRGEEIRPKGYVAVAIDGSGIVRLLEITEKAFDENPLLWEESGLRGRYFVAKRKGENNNSPLIVDTSENKKSFVQLPQDIDVREVLFKMWFGKEKNRRRKEV